MLADGAPPGASAGDFGAMEAHVVDAAGLLKAMGNRYRLWVLCLLSQRPMTVSEINQHVPLTQSALSQHLAVLRRDGLVKTRRDSQTIYYRVTPGVAAEVLQVLHAHFCPRDNK